MESILWRNNNSLISIKTIWRKEFDIRFKYVYCVVLKEAIVSSGLFHFLLE